MSPDDDTLIELLAALEHERWSGWEKYRDTVDSPVSRERWGRQRETPYAELSEREKESDRVEARKTIALLRAHGVLGRTSDIGVLTHIRSTPGKTLHFEGDATNATEVANLIRKVARSIEHDREIGGELGPSRISIEVWLKDPGDE